MWCWFLVKKNCWYIGLNALAHHVYYLLNILTFQKGIICEFVLSKDVTVYTESYGCFTCLITLQIQWHLSALLPCKWSGSSVWVDEVYKLNPTVTNERKELLQNTCFLLFVLDKNGGPDSLTWFLWGIKCNSFCWLNDHLDSPFTIAGTVNQTA